MDTRVDREQFPMGISIACPSCKRQVTAKIETNGNGTWKCKCGDYGKCGFR